MRTICKGTLEYLVADNIVAPHAFTTRLGGVSSGHLASMNIALRPEETPENVEKNLEILANGIGFSKSNVVLTRQTHSSIVRTVSKSHHLGLLHHDYPECDGLITNDPETALIIYTADCTPILLWDSVTGAVGAVHAGWRGTAAKIAAKAALQMCRDFGCQPENLHAAIGPNIGACCFETHADVPEAMLCSYGDAASPWIQKSAEKYYVNLKEINALALREVGVTSIQISDACTACQPHRFWSHRITHVLRGSQGAIIVCKEGRE